MKSNYVDNQKREIQFARMVLQDAPPKDVAKNRGNRELGISKAQCEKLFGQWDERRREAEELGPFQVVYNNLLLDEQEFRFDLLALMYAETFDNAQDTRDHNTDLNEIAMAKNDAWITTALGVCERLGYEDMLTRGESLFPNVFAKDEGGDE